MEKGMKEGQNAPPPKNPVGRKKIYRFHFIYKFIHFSPKRKKNIENDHWKSSGVVKRRPFFEKVFILFIFKGEGGQI